MAKPWLYIGPGVIGDSGDSQTRPLGCGVGQQVIDGPLHAVAVGAAAGRAAAGQEGHAAKAADRGVAAHAALAEAAVIVLPACEPLQALVDASLGRRSEHFAGRFFRVGRLGRGGSRADCES